ncbi:MAG: succinyl-diaminopimelate desuccinylase [Azoarcus sp.]|jgi:succinyl-diaminopimelate desuccinylase|nr:succinyl-diaminopimelate desuccinylase [Azoarcus sp.]
MMTAISTFSGNPTLALAADLIARPSITPEDGACLELLAARLAPLGFRLERFDCGMVRNLWARRGDASPIVCFAGHVDVVPSGPESAWRSPPFTPEIRDGHLYGRGAADMKASLAAFITAIEAFVASHPDHAGSIAVLLTSDEEGAAVDGTAKVVEALRERGERLDYCIVGEPTSGARFGDTIKNGRRGSLSADLKVRGQQGHVAYPQRARNPIHALAPALAELIATVWDEGDEFFPPTSCQVSNIHAGTGANNVIPGECEVLFNFRFAPVSSADNLKARSEAIFRRHGLDYEIDWQLSGKPFRTGHGSLLAALAAAIHAATGIEPELSTDGGTSDGRFIADICDEVAEFGPINATIHKIDECVAVESLAALADVYRRVLNRLLAGEHQYEH